MNLFVKLFKMVKIDQNDKNDKKYLFLYYVYTI